MTFIVQNISASIPGKFHRNPNNNSLDSSLGILNADELKNTFSDCDVTKENISPSNVSLGRYLQPLSTRSHVHPDSSLGSQPLSDSEEEQEVPLVTNNDSFQFQAPLPPISLPQPFIPSPQILEESSASINGFSWDKVAQANTAEQTMPFPEVKCQHI